MSEDDEIMIGIRKGVENALKQSLTSDVMILYVMLKILDKLQSIDTSIDLIIDNSND